MADINANRTDPTKIRMVDMREVGVSGLRRFSGFLYDEFVPELVGWSGIRIYNEMRKNDPVVWACLTAIYMLCRKVPWRMVPASKEPYDKECAEFVETCLNDMSAPWADIVIEILTMLPFGYSAEEIVYKRRCGDVIDPTMRSKYQDGRIGWRKFSIRSQDTIYRWQFDDHGGIQGFEQIAPPHYLHVTIPIEKLLLFRTVIEKNNPEGLSILRGAWRPWYMKKNIENIEAVGIERDLAGLPVFGVPPELLDPNASTEAKQTLAKIQEIVRNVRNDEQAGVVMPLAYDANGREIYKFQLMSAGGSKQFDTNKTIERYDQRIAMTILADFMLLGHQNVGSFALIDGKKSLFCTAIGAFLDIISDVMNNFAIPRLIKLNDFKISNYPRLEHGDIENVDLNSLGDYIQKLAGAGYPLFPNMDLEKYLMKVANLPEPLEEAASEEQQVTPQLPDEPEKVVDLRDPSDDKPHPIGPNIHDRTPAETSKQNPAVQTGMQYTNRMPTHGVRI